MALCLAHKVPILAVTPRGWVALSCIVLAPCPQLPSTLPGSKIAPGCGLQAPGTRSAPSYHRLSPSPNVGLSRHFRGPPQFRACERSDAESLEEASWVDPEDTSSGAGGLRTTVEIPACVRGVVPGSTAGLALTAAHRPLTAPARGAPALPDRSPRLEKLADQLRSVGG